MGPGLRSPGRVGLPKIGFARRDAGAGGGFQLRILVTIPHYFRPAAGTDAASALGSGLDPLTKIAALNEMLVALHRHFGPRRHGMGSADPLPGDDPSASRLDIVILKVDGHHLLDWVGLERASFEVVEFDGPPLMLGFEAQRVLRERAGSYDLYAYMEDDLILHDPEFFAKILWFGREFGPTALLQPTRYELSRSSTPGKVAIRFEMSDRRLAPFRRPGAREKVAGSWHGREQSFALSENPHAGCYFLTDRQLRHWLAQPSFFDRDASWIDPLASAATLSVGKVFDLYKCAAPDPWFLEIEHYGVRYAAYCAPPGVTYGESPLLALAQRAPQGEAAGPPAGSTTINALVGEATRLRIELDGLLASRSRLFRAFLRALFRKKTF